MPHFIFLIGHPASGKSSLYARMEPLLAQRGLSCILVSDRPFFWQAMQADAGQELHKMHPDGSHEITSQAFFELQLALLREHLLETEWIEDLVFVELTSPDYAACLRSLGDAFVERSALILLLASRQNALGRNLSRPEPSSQADNGRVPEQYINRCFDQDFDLQDLPQAFETALVLSNDGSSLNDLDKLAGQAAAFILGL